MKQRHRTTRISLNIDRLVLYSVRGPVRNSRRLLSYEYTLRHLHTELGALVRITVISLSYLNVMAEFISGWDRNIMLTIVVQLKASQFYSQFSLVLLAYANSLNLTRSKMTYYEFCDQL